MCTTSPTWSAGASPACSWRRREFVDAADAQAEALGFDAGAGVRRRIPIQDRTDDEMRALADAAVDEIVAAVTADEEESEHGAGL